MLVPGHHRRQDDRGQLLGLVLLQEVPSSHHGRARLPFAAGDPLMKDLVGPARHAVLIGEAGDERLAELLQPKPVPKAL